MNTNESKALAALKDGTAVKVVLNRRLGCKLEPGEYLFEFVRLSEYNIVILRDSLTKQEWEPYLSELDAITPLESQPVAETVGREIDLAFQVLELYGVSRDRAVTVANGIEVLATRYRKQLGPKFSHDDIREAERLSQELGAGSYIPGLSDELPTPQPVAGQVIGEAVEALAKVREKVQAVINTRDIRPLVNIEASYEKIEAALRTSQQPQAPAVEVVSVEKTDWNVLEAEFWKGWNSYGFQGVAVTDIGRIQAGLETMRHLLTSKGGR